jgi:hypothetical protein
MVDPFMRHFFRNQFVHFPSPEEGMLKVGLPILKKDWYLNHHHFTI